MRNLELPTAKTGHLSSRLWSCGRFSLPLGAKTYVMAILNATPDSFSGDGLAQNFSTDRVRDAAVSQALQAIENGADILDIGGESTRPGAAEVSEDEEIRRVVPLIEELAARVAVPISIDTTKSSVARRALTAGASIVNDISGATADAQMWPLLAQSNCGCVLMHRRGTPQTMRASVRVTENRTGENATNETHFSSAQSSKSSTRNADNSALQSDVVAEILEFWRRCVEKAGEFGIVHERIAFDAGFGFGKSLEENLEIVRRGREFSDFGFPTLSGTSRKSTILRVLDNAETAAQNERNSAQSHEKNTEVPTDECAAKLENLGATRWYNAKNENGIAVPEEFTARVWGTAATVALAISGGADIVRVHDVREMAQIARMSDAITRTLR